MSLSTHQPHQMMKSKKYYHDKAIQAAEEYGACLAESFMYPFDSKEYIEWTARAEQAYKTMFEYISKARNFTPTPDYET